MTNATKNVGAGYANARLPHVESRLRNAMLVVTSPAGYGAGAITGPMPARSLGDRARGSLAAVLKPATLLIWLAGIDVAAAFHSVSFLQPSRHCRGSCS